MNGSDLAENAMGAFIFAGAALGVPLDRQELTRKYLTVNGTFGVTEILRAAKTAELKARHVTVPWARLQRTPMPALAILNDGRFWVLGLVSEDKILIQDPAAPRPAHVTKAEFEALWSGQLILLARRAKAEGAAPTFDLRWFLTAVYRYRKALGEVLVASFFIQLIGLASPLFFQVVVDKVLVPSRPVDARRADDRAGDHLDLRGRARHAAHLPVQPHHQPDRCRAGGQGVRPSAGAADRLFRQPPGGRQRCPGARAGDDPHLHHRLVADADDRPVLHAGLPRRDVPLQPAADLDRDRLAAALCCHQRRGDADLPPPAG